MRGGTMRWDARAVRGQLRLVSALVMLAFVICHLTAHAFLLVSIDAGDAALGILLAPWWTDIGMAALIAAAIVHYANALWSLYLRRSLHLSRWEWWQLGLGLCIPVLLIHHMRPPRPAAAGLTLASETLHECAVKGRAQTVQFYALQAAPKVAP
jgi:succinate dehydrogenase/fumarate reductase cytochrome b subunit